jgi:hypothetical protein
LQTINAFCETSVQCRQHFDLVFDLLPFLLIECQERLLTDWQGVGERSILGTVEDLFDLLGGETKTQVHLNCVHALDGLLIEIAIAIGEALRTEQPFLFIVTQGADAHSSATSYLANAHDSLSFPDA